MYKPLPSFLTVKESSIEGLGLFATEDIPKGKCLGVTHYKIPSSIGLLRTPLGGFYNHSYTPNCHKISFNLLDDNENKVGNVFEIEAIRDIKAGEEITVQYTFYGL